MKNNKKKVPEVRFKGFSNDWEQRKFVEIFKEFNVKSTTEDKYVVLSSTNSGMEIREGRVSGKSNKGYKIIEDGDLVLSPQNLWLGNINVNNIGKGLVSPSYRTFKFSRVDKKFIEPQLRLPRMLEEYKNASTQGASVVRRNLELESFYRIPIKIPSEKEQEKIGAFFKQLDNAITLHQRRLEALQQLKNGFMQVMFPQKREDIPRLRFADFGDEWEEHELNDILKERNEQMPANENFQLMSFTATEGVTSKSDRYNREFLVKTKNKKYKKTEKGDLIYSSNNLDVGSIGLNNTGNAVISPVYSIFRVKDGITPDFMGMLIQRKRFINKMLRYRQGVVYGQWKIHETDFLSIHTSIPSSEEQRRIGNYFKQLDSIVVLYKTKLEKLKSLKKAYLQKMFI